VLRLAVRQARVRFSARHPMRLLLLSGEAMKIQEDGPRQMMKDERIYDCIVRMNVKIISVKKSGIIHQTFEVSLHPIRCPCFRSCRCPCRCCCGCHSDVAAPMKWLPLAAMVAYVLAAIAAPLPPLLRLPQVPLLRHCYPFLDQPVLTPACVQFLWLGLRY
jgi:hypothetical protein